MKRLRVLILVAALAVPIVSLAFVPALFSAFMFANAITGSTVLTNSLIASGTIIGALMLMPLSQSSVNLTAADLKAKAPVTIYLAPDKKRVNPDPNRWDDASGTSVDPTPKASFSAHQGTSTAPSTFPAIVSAIGGAGESLWMIYDASRDVKYLSVDTTSWNLSLPCNSYANADKVPSGYSAAWCGSVTVNNTTKTYAVYSQLSTVICPTGYTKDSNGVCQKSVADSQIMKPSTTPCEIVPRSDGSIDTDSRNPNCVDSISQGNVAQPNSRTIRTVISSGFQDTSFDADGGVTVTQNNNNGSKTIVHAGPYDSSTGGRLVDTVTSTGGGGSSGTASGGTTGSASGSAVCGGPGLPACSVNIDDSGFQGKDTAVSTAADAAKAKLDERQAFIESKANDNSNFGLDTNWIPSMVPGPAVTCNSLKWEPGISHGPLASLSGSVDIDWCSKLDLVRDYYAWLVGMATVWAIVMLFFSSNGSPHSGK